MKLFKRVRGFLRSRIPFLRKKKKDVAAQINEGFQDDGQDFGIAEQGCEFAQDSKSDELDGPVPSEMLNETLKSDVELTYSRDNVNDREKSVGSVPFSSEIDMMPHSQFPTESLKEDLTAAIAVISNKVGFHEGDRVKYEEYAPFSAEVIPNKVGFVEGDIVKYEEDAPFSAEVIPNGVGFVEGDKVKYEEDAPFSAEVIPNKVGFVEGDIVKYEEYAPFSAEVIPNGVGFVEGDIVKYEEDAPFSAEVIPNGVGFVEGDKVKYEDAPFSAEKCMTLHGPSSQENSDESLECRLSYSIKHELLSKGQSEEKFDCCYDDDEMAIVNCQLSPEKIVVCDGLADPNENSKFEVDFEGAFGRNMKEPDTDDPWYHVTSKTIENVGHSSEYHRFGLEKDNEFGEEFDAVREQYGKRHKIDRYEDAFCFNIENPYNEGHFIEKNPIDVNYDFAYDDDSDEGIEMKKTQKKKLKVVIRDRPVKNVTLQKLFLYSDVDNHMYIREIKDPLKRKDVVRSDLTGFKHVPVWDSTNMKKYYSYGDLGRPPPDFSMTFSNVKE